MPHELPPNFHQVKLDEERYFAHERQMKVPACGNCGCVHSPTIKCEEIFRNKDAPPEVATSKIKLTQLIRLNLSHRDGEIMIGRRDDHRCYLITEASTFHNDEVFAGLGSTEHIEISFEAFEHLAQIPRPHEAGPLTAANWKKLYDEAAAAFLDVQSALVRLLNAHHPKPLGAIIDPVERRRAIHEDNVEALEATQHAHQTLHKYSPFADTGNVLTD